MRIPTEPPKIHQLMTDLKSMLVSLSVADRTRVLIVKFSLGATASGILWLANPRKQMGFRFKQPLVGKKRCVTTQITAAEKTKFVWMSKEFQMGLLQCSLIKKAWARLRNGFWNRLWTSLIHWFPSSGNYLSLRIKGTTFSTVSAAKNILK